MEQHFKVILTKFVNRPLNHPGMDGSSYNDVIKGFQVVPAPSGDPDEFNTFSKVLLEF
jgi:hypothetical protein